MNKKEQIAFWKRQKQIGEDLILVAEQSKQVAARIVSEAEAALKELGGSPGRARKGCVLTPAQILDIKASLTR